MLTHRAIRREYEEAGSVNALIALWAFVDDGTLDEREHEEAAGPAFRRSFLRAFAIAAIIGLLIGIVWTIVGLWHFHVSRLF